VNWPRDLNIRGTSSISLGLENTDSRLRWPRTFPYSPGCCSRHAVARERGGPDSGKVLSWAAGTTSDFRAPVPPPDEWDSTMLAALPQAPRFSRPNLTCRRRWRTPPAMSDFARTVATLFEFYARARRVACHIGDGPETIHAYPM